MSNNQQEFIDSLREKGRITTTINAQEREYTVATTVKATKFGWYYEITVTPHDRKITATEEGRDEVPSYDTEAKWTLFLQQVAQKHADKCHAISNDITLQAANRKRFFIAIALAGGVLAAVAGYFYLQPLTARVRPSTPPVSTTPVPPETAAPPPATEYSGGAEATAPTPIEPTAPQKIEDMLTPPPLPAKPPSPPPATRLENRSGETSTKQSSSKEDEIRCIISPKDCPPSRK